MTSVYVNDDGDAMDREYERALQRELDAFHEGRQAGREQQRVEMNPYLPIEPAYTQWLDGWREGTAQTITPRRAA